MVRVAGIYGQIAAGVTTLSAGRPDPAQQLAAINEFVAGLVRDQQACWSELKAELAAAGVEIAEAETLRAGERDWLENVFMTHVFPILTPIAVDPAHPTRSSSTAASPSSR